MDALTSGEPQRFELVVDGRRLEVARYTGDASRPAIVLLHEGLGSVAMWRDFPAELAARTRRSVVAYSRWGYGASEALEGARDVRYMHREGEVVLPSLVAQLGLERPVLFGHSDGASIALIAAGAHPHLASALILEAPHVIVEDLSVASIEQARSAWETTDLPARLARYHADPAGAFRGWNDVWLDARFRAWNIEEYVTAIRCPLLVIQGDRDEYGTLDQVARIAARAPQTQTFVVPGVGHAPHRQRPRDVLDRAAAFLVSGAEILPGS
jgi:pimeloyl-ACP methyl ester carboxylesterase